MYGTGNSGFDAKVNKQTNKQKDTGNCPRWTSSVEHRCDNRRKGSIKRASCSEEYFCDHARRLLPLHEDIPGCLVYHLETIYLLVPTIRRRPNSEIFLVQPTRRSNGSRHPVDHDVCQQVIQ